MNDMISRQAAINAIENTECELSPEAWDELTNAIMSAPSATPKSHGVCMNCLVADICRFRLGLGDYGYCSQWQVREV